MNMVCLCGVGKVPSKLGLYLPVSSWACHTGLEFFSKLKGVCVEPGSGGRA